MHAGELVRLSEASLPVPGLSELVVPSPVMAEGERAAVRYVEFFTAQIRNPNTRAAYARAASAFFGWCEAHGDLVAWICQESSKISDLR